MPKKTPKPAPAGPIVAIVIIAVVVVIGLFMMWKMQMQTPAAPPVPAQGDITLTGSMTCLPHRDTSGAQTLECAFGLRTDDGTFYALHDSDPSYANISSVPTNGRVEVHGLFLPQDDTKYASVGIITVDRITVLNAATSTPPTNQDTTSDGVISFSKPTDFGLAVTPEQVLVTSYIPSCDPGFGYCLYYNGTTYQGTNFESAGLAIRRRNELDSQAKCLTTSPEGYTNLKPKTAQHTNYAISLFAPLGDAGAGHYAIGEEYHVYTGNTCYQIDLRIGETQFLNYPTGSIKEFTETNRNTMLNTLRGLIANIQLIKSGDTLVLPK